MSKNEAHKCLNIHCYYNIFSAKQNKFIELFEQFFLSETIINGDFNIDINKKMNVKSWLKNCKPMGLTQLIKGHTRVTETSATNLDHIYVNRPMNISNSGII